MQRYAIKYVRTPLPLGVDEGDLPWSPVAGHGDYADEVEAWRACDEFDAAFDNSYVHRVVPVNDNEDS